VSIKSHRSIPPATRKRAKTPKAVVRRARPHRRTHAEVEAEMLALVRKGVKNFIFEKATIRDFLNGLRDISAGKTYPHQLTQAVFTKIVREAVKKRKARSSGLA
jgi:hypothetical protein